MTEKQRIMTLLQATVCGAKKSNPGRNGHIFRQVQPSHVEPGTENINRPITSNKIDTSV